MNNLNKTDRIAGKKIIQKGLIDERQLYHPFGVFVLHYLSCYNHRIPLGLKTKTRRVERIIEMISLCIFQTRRVDKIIDNKGEIRNYHPVGVSDLHRNSCYNHHIPLGLKTKTRRVERIIEMISLCNFQTQRVDKIIDNKSERRNYHPVGVSDLHRNSCYNHHIPLGLKTKF